MEYSAAVKNTAEEIFELWCDLEDKRIAFNSPHGATLLFGVIQKVIDAETARANEWEKLCKDATDTLNAEREEEKKERSIFENMMTTFGICTTCKQEFDFSEHEPFAFCRCGTTEWGSGRPKHITQQYEIERLKSIIEKSCIDKLDSSAPKNVKYGSYDADGNFIPPDGLPNIPALEAACNVFEQNSADISVFYETLYKIANYGRDMQFMREIAADCINGKEKHSLIEKLQKKAEQYRLEKDRSCAEAMEELIREIDHERKP